MSRRIRIRDKTTPELNVTAFMNLMVVLVPFLLITAVFSRITVLQLNLPEGSSANQDPKQELQVEVIIRKDYLDVGTQLGGRIQCIPRTEEGYNYKTLSDLIQQIKVRLPDKSNISLLAEKDVPYDVIVQVMDKVRSIKQVSAGEVVDAALFPDIAIGDAPALNAAQKKAGCGTP